MSKYGKDNNMYSALLHDSETTSTISTKQEGTSSDTKQQASTHADYPFSIDDFAEYLERLKNPKLGKPQRTANEKKLKNIWKDMCTYSRQRFEQNLACPDGYETPLRPRELHRSTMSGDAEINMALDALKKADPRTFTQQWLNQAVYELLSLEEKYFKFDKESECQGLHELTRLSVPASGDSGGSSKDERTRRPYKYQTYKLSIKSLEGKIKGFKLLVKQEKEDERKLLGGAGSRDEIKDEKGGIQRDLKK